MDIKIKDGEIVLDSEDFYFTEGIDEITQHIKTKLCTNLGQLFYNKKFGCSLLKYIQSNNNPDNMLMIKTDIYSAISEESTFTVKDVILTTNDNELLINITIIVNSNEINIILSSQEFNFR